MNKELYFICAPSEFKTGVKIYPPTVKEVITNEYYGHYIKLLTYSQEEIEDEFMEAKKELESYPTPFEFMLNNSYHNKQYEQLCKDAFKFFLHTEVSFLYEQKKIIVGNIAEALKKAKTIEDLIVITEEEFFSFQNVISESVGKKTVEQYNPNEHPK